MDQVLQKAGLRNLKNAETGTIGKVYLAIHSKFIYNDHLGYVKIDLKCDRFRNNGSDLKQYVLEATCQKDERGMPIRFSNININ